MTRIVSQTAWEVDLPSEWLAECDDIPVTIHHPRGVGVLQISSYSKESCVTDDDLLAFAHEYSANTAEICAVTCGQFVGITSRFSIDDRCWQHWYLRSGARMLFATYNCANRDRGLEVEAIEQIMATLRER